MAEKLGKELIATEERMSCGNIRIPAEDTHMWLLIELATNIADSIELSTNMLLSATSVELGIHDHGNANAFFDTGNGYCSAVNARYTLHNRIVTGNTGDILKGLNSEGVLARLEEVDMKVPVAKSEFGSFGAQIARVSEVNTGWGDSVGPMRSAAGRNQIRAHISSRCAIHKRRQTHEAHVAWVFTVALIRTMLRGLAQHFFGGDYIPGEWDTDLYGPLPEAPSEIMRLAKKLETVAFTPQALFRPESLRG
jgi:hypothetical protein